ncbi:MAG: DUF2461 domain-containing protein [Lachnospiraceae bacterium]|nr:DUF2461 domain-containing protein [Lachnospiraceae bacterium]
MSKNILSYLSQLEQNNNREWYHSHKKEYQTAMQDFENIIQGLIMEIGKTDSSILHNNPKDLTFKLVRDTRFFHDKSPYNPVFRCHIAPAGKLPVPVGYFLFIAPGNRSFLGGGLFADMFKDATGLVRKYINSHREEFLNIVEQSDFKKHFEVKGTSLKKVPKEYEANSPVSEYIKYKSWYLEFPLLDEHLLADESDFVSYAAEIFLLMKPFNDFLNRALEGFVLPER